jgi:uncharacterized phage protein gp47/JayE
MMPDILDPNGLTVKTITELVTELTSAFQSIYGNDINLNSNSPDAQIINIFAQQGVDLREVDMSVYNSFSLDRAAGVVLDERLSLINTTRNGGTFTIVPITVIATQPCFLQGLDADLNNTNGAGYTISDDTGNQYILTTSETITTPGTYIYNFRAANIGQVEVVPNTITNQVDVVLGIASVNNPGSAIITGEDTETDFQFRTRGKLSAANSSIAQIDGLRGDILSLTGVTECFCYENITGATDSNGIPSGGIWVIVEGGNNNDIAQVIYNHLNANPMKGNIAVNINTTSNQIFVVKFDNPILTPLYIKFNIQPTVTGITFDTTGIANYISENLTYIIQEYSETSKITAVIVQAIDSITGNGVPTEVKISIDNTNWFDYISAPTLSSQFEILANNITITVL